jgi:hypothetical protein
MRSMDVRVERSVRLVTNAAGTDLLTILQLLIAAEHSLYAHAGILVRKSRMPAIINLT